MHPSAAQLKQRKINYEFQQDKPMLIGLYTFFLIGALVLSGIAVYYFKESLQLLRNGINTTAIVTEFLEVTDDDGTNYRPVFTFTDIEGNKIRFEYPHSSSHSVWRRGEAVSIVYDPTMPSIAKVVSYWDLFRASLICMIFALPLFLVSVGYFTFLSFASSFRIGQH